LAEAAGVLEWYQVLSDEVRSVRVIAGSFKGVRLTAPPGDIARPTTDRVKESMFHLMGLGWDGGTVLDLFAGSGALGLEALSRGADRAVLVDRHPRAIAAIRQNVDRCNVRDKVLVWRADWRQAVSRAAAEIGGVTWVFVDPPYAKRLWKAVLDAVAESGLRVHEGIVCEHPAGEPMPAETAAFSVWKSRTYGDIGITIYIPKEGGDPDAEGGLPGEL
jgi:16S rRNA (guanine966-N2)-methyltransferase